LSDDLPISAPRVTRETFTAHVSQGVGRASLTHS